MKATDKKKTADAITEHSTWMRIGWLPIRLRPLTLGQIYEMGEFVENLQAEGLDLNNDKRFNLVAEMLSRYKSAPLMQDAFMIAAYRRCWARKLFRKYILQRLTIRKFQPVLEMITDSYAANFFLTSIIFLHQTKPITEPKPTTHLGPSLEG
ncbi:hypothetical protein I6E23_05815 [Prevotella brevis]|nr:hypothetical protein [Xylanibacter brevis]